MNQKNNSGFTLIEHLIAIVLLGMMLTTLVGAYSTLIASKTRSHMTQEATQLAREKMEELYNMISQANNWGNFSHHVKFNHGGCNRVRPRLNPNVGWQFDEGAAAATGDELQGGLFTRHTDFCVVYRDSSGEIMETGTRPQVDENTVKIIVTVSSTHPQMKEDVVMVTYVTNSKNE